MLEKDKLLSRLPQRIKRLLLENTVQTVDLGRSGTTVLRLGDTAYLKISRDPLALHAEKERDLWLENRLSAPQVLDFEEYPKEDKKTPKFAFLLTSAVKGKPLCDSEYLKNPDKLTTYLAEAMAEFHALSFKDCPFFAERSEKSEGGVVCHGDFCLPNILYDGKAFGFIDLGDMGRGDPWLDYAWCLWSLDYNLNTSRYRKLMLEKLGIDFDEARYLKYTE